MARKILGITFIVAAVIGLIFSLAGIILVWSVRIPLTTNLVSTLELIDTTLEATSSGLTVVEETITQSVSDINSLENTVRTAGQGVEDSVPLVESLSTLMSQDIPTAINATQTSLTTMQDAAGTIESSLKLVTSIPFLPIEGYDPEVSLSESLEDVSQSLDAIPQSLAEMETTMNTTKGNLIMLSAQVNIIARNISELKDSLYELSFVFDQYQDAISTIQTKVDSSRQNLASTITIGAWFFTVILIWLGIAQVGLLTQGIERLDRHPGDQPSQADGTPREETTPAEQEGEQE